MPAPLRRSRLLSALALAAVLAVAACGGSEHQQEDATTTSSSSSAPVLDPDEDKVRLTERQPEVMADAESQWTLEVTAFENAEEPVVVLELEPDDGQSETHHLVLGDSVDIAGRSWRLSEIAISDASEQPGSATLVRQS